MPRPFTPERLGDDAAWRQFMGLRPRPIDEPSELVMADFDAWVLSQRGLRGNRPATTPSIPPMAAKMYNDV